MPHLRWFSIIAISWVLTACGSDSADVAATSARDTLPNGAIVVRYHGLPDAGTVLREDLSFGVMEGDSNLIFGDIRGIEAGSDGTIYVLDYQASQVRAFDSRGRFLRRLTRRGKGPGEITEANGMVLIGDSALWIQDHSQWMMIAVDLEGEELTRVPMHVRAYAYMWNGTIDHRGRFWKPTSHSDEPRVFTPPEGLNEGRSRSYLKSYDPETDTADSVFVGATAYRSYVARNDRGGQTYRGIPYDSHPITIVDPAGGFWRAYGTDYRVARLDEQGDTVMVIEVGAEPIPVTDEDRERYIQSAVESSPSSLRLAEEVAALMPPFKPAIAQLVLDDVGQLWVRRTGPPGGTTTYDVFRPDGEYAGTVTLSFDAHRYLPIRIRDGRGYALVTDSLDVPSVVRTEPIPSFLQLITSR